MAYKPTGKPPGRPKKPPEADSEPKAEFYTHPAEYMKKPPAPGHEAADGSPLGALCATCWPLGWPGTATGLGCPHGSWARRL